MNLLLDASFFIRYVQSWIQELSQYEPILYFDWDTFVNLLEKEPLALTAVAIAFLNIVFTIFFKLSDSWKEARKEAQQRAVLHIEAHPIQAAKNTPGSLQIILTNVGREPLVIRDVGYQQRPLTLRLLHNLSPIRIPTYKPFDRSRLSEDLPDTRWPIVIHPREFFEFQIQGDLLKQLKKTHHRLTVRDSLANLWTYRGASISRFIKKTHPAPSNPSPYKAPDLSPALIAVSENKTMPIDGDASCHTAGQDALSDINHSELAISK